MNPAISTINKKKGLITLALDGLLYQAKKDPNYQLPNNGKTVAGYIQLFRQAKPEIFEKGTVLEQINEMILFLNS